MLDILGLVSGIGTVVSTANGVIDLINKIKPALKQEEPNPHAFQTPPPAPTPSPLFSMQPFQPQQIDPYQQGQQWLPQLQWVAQTHGNPWVPAQTQPLFQVNLTGVWCPPDNWYEHTYIRQFGPYLNLIAGMAGGMVGVFAEGLLNPTNGFVHIVGRYANGMPIEVRAQLYPNWTLQGSKVFPGPFGQPMQMIFVLGKIA